MEPIQQLVDGLTQQKRTALLLGAAGALLGLGLWVKLLRKKEKVERVGVVSRLLVHPLKSGKALSVSAAECLQVGLKSGELRDRHWLVVTEDSHMVTARQEPRLVLVSMTCDGGDGGVCLRGPDMEELRFPIEQPENRLLNCRVFGLDVQGRDCGDEVSRWFTSFLAAQKTFRLVHFEPQMKGRRPMEAEPQFPQCEVAYPDTGPVMLLSEASVEDLSSRLDQQVTAERFRPNIVVGECEAFDEDSWEEIQIGSVRLQRVMSCGRCILTTVDPETGILSRKEPLDTLKSYRLCQPAERHIYKSSPLFGQVLKVLQEGRVQVGDAVYKVSR